ncbi:glutathione S-transferase [Sphingobium indicum IP26]|uniref:glutathione S-transferase family protein n=1 Tax=Sphingobium TaxID=165695 RepID=UPI00035E3272|nr:glutathione S-transferase family protein [Sphingobium sp. HDIP04]EPR18059.1 glutathione S-transferase [Sphingobium indicum IP26]EQA97528.1 glutathione S-transferase [Sphingobium sp. HDIP04]
MILYYHPLSSCSWKVLIALYENGTPFEPRMLDDPAVAEAWLALWPLGKFPVLRDETRDRTVAETSIIIEYLGRHRPGPFRPIPEDADAALEVRLMDRLFDIYVMTPMQAIVAEKIRPQGVARDSHGVGEARRMLGKAYALLEARMAGRRWAAGDDFTLADCAAAPALFYADKIEPMRGGFPALRAYLERLEARESFARVLREKEPWWPMFPFAD